MCGSFRDHPWDGFSGSVGGTFAWIRRLLSEIAPCTKVVVLSTNFLRVLAKLVEMIANDVTIVFRGGAPPAPAPHDSPNILRDTTHANHRGKQQSCIHPARSPTYGLRYSMLSCHAVSCISVSLGALFAHFGPCVSLVGGCGEVILRGL